MKNVDGKKFDNFISLGFNCGVACALEKYGLRGKRMPFDWYISDWIGVETCLKTEFDGFLQLENCDMETRGQFVDRKFNFLFPHELVAGETIQGKYIEIVNKYKKDIYNFYEYITNPTCFIRAIKNIEEYNYILKTRSKIVSIIKKYNVDNEIIFLLQDSDAKKISEQLQDCFYVVQDYSNEQCEKDNLFDINNELIGYLVEHSDEMRRTQNIEFSVKRVWKKFEKYYSRYNILNLIYECSISRLEQYLEKRHWQSVAIWGGGKIGVALKSLVDQTNATVLYFVDLYCEQEECESLRIYGKEELPYVDLIIITPIWDEHEVINLLDSMNIYGSSIICVDGLLKECKR